MSAIPLKTNSNHRVIIDAETLAFKNWKVRLDDITGLSFGQFTTHYYLSNSGGRISVHTASARYEIAATNIGVLGFFEGKDNMGQIIEVVRQAIAPRLLQKLLTYIFERDVPVDIARFTLTRTGLSHKGIAGVIQIPWSYRPLCRTTTKTRWLTGGTVYGVQEVFYFNPQTGKNVALGTVSSTDMNGFLLPIIIEIIAKQFTPNT